MIVQTTVCPREVIQERFFRRKLEVRIVNQITENLEYYRHPVLEIIHSSSMLPHSMPCQQEARASWKGQIMRVSRG